MNKRSHYAYKLENKEMRREEGEVHIYIEWTPPLAVNYMYWIIFQRAKTATEQVTKYSIVNNCSLYCS